MLDFLETELAVERTLTQGRAAREANIATALQASVGSLAATACDLLRARPARRPRLGSGTHPGRVRWPLSAGRVARGWGGAAGPATRDNLGACSSPL